MGGDSLDHGRGVLQRQPHDQPAMLRRPEPSGLLAGAADPPVSQLNVPARIAAGDLAQQGAGDRQRTDRNQAVGHHGDATIFAVSSGPASATVPEVPIEMVVTGASAAR